MFLVLFFLFLAKFCLTFLEIGGDARGIYCMSDHKKKKQPCVINDEYTSIKCKQGDTKEIQAIRVSFVIKLKLLEIKMA